VVTVAAGGSDRMNAFYFAAKAPLAGQVKTRLGTSIGMAAAAKLYSAFLLDLSQRFRSARFTTRWYLAPGSEQHVLHLTATSPPFRAQRGKGWAERQANLFKVCAAEGETRVVLAATDSPQLRPERVKEAFDALAIHDAVVGPTHDGGYYLIGMRGFHDILEGVEMSTESALGQVLARARTRRVSVAHLEAEFDVDHEGDLPRLAREVARRDDLAYTAAALASIQGTLAESRIA
jgi:rSAM/selenodomain-associated transferase 1